MAVVELFCTGLVGLLVWLLVVCVGVVFLIVIIFAACVKCRGLAGVLVGKCNSLAQVPLGDEVGSFSAMDCQQQVQQHWYSTPNFIFARVT